MSYEEELAKNDALKATLMKLKSAEPAPVAASTKKAEGMLKIVDLQEAAFKTTQTIDHMEMEKKHLEMKIKEEQAKLKATELEIDKVRSSGKAVWETVGIQTVPYNDPFHTGLSKRTPTGARSAAAAARAPVFFPALSSPPQRLLRAVITPSFAPGKMPRALLIAATRAPTRLAGGYFTS